MARDLPPTTALRAFARAACTLSFRRAAAELHVSPSALSRQIQALEELLGAPLFLRLNPGLELTEAGQSYLAVVERVLDALESAQDALEPRPKPLKVSALESFTTNWLMPNLQHFERLHPEVELEIEATLRYADFAREPVDVAIRFGVGPWGALDNQPLLDLFVSPICSPALRTGVPPLTTPADLAKHTLIHIAQTPDAWSHWLAAAGVEGLEPRRAVTYDHVGIALSAAEAGHGVALVPELLCRRWQRAGTLCRPFARQLRSEATYHFVCRREQRDDPRIQALRTWMLAQLRADAPGATLDAK